MTKIWMCGWFSLCATTNKKVVGVAGSEGMSWLRRLAMSMTSTISFPSVFSTWGRNRTLGKILLFYFIKIVVTALYHKDWLSNFTSSVIKEHDTSWKGDTFYDLFSVLVGVTGERCTGYMLTAPGNLLKLHRNKLIKTRNSFEPRLDSGIAMVE